MAEKELRLRRRLLQLHFEAGVGHIGGNLSCIDILSTLFQRMNWQDDRFILSKGHSAGALYVALWSVGRMSDEELRSFHKDDSQVGGHPSALFKKEIPFFTGSLGHGFSLACGMALAKKLRGEKGRVYVLMSDGEWQEGSCWEALNFALHHRLDNLSVLVDFNQIQGFGRLQETLSMQNLPERLRAMGSEVRIVPGHHCEKIDAALALGAQESKTDFQILFFQTTKGQGVSFMQDQVDWHYWTMTEEHYKNALHEIDTQLAATPDKLGAP